MAEHTEIKKDETPPIVELSADDVFEQAFAQLSEAIGEDKPISKAVPTAKVEPKEEPKEEPKVPDDEGLPPDDKEVRAKVEPKEEPKVPPKAELSDDELARRLAALVGKTEPAPEPRQEPAPQPPPNIYTPEDQSFLSEYMKEYPDIAKGEFLRRRAEYAGLVEFVFGEVSKVVGPRLEMLETLLQRTHLGDLKQAVPTYDTTLREQVVSWVDKQPAYLKPAYQYVINQGTVDDVKDLIARYQADTGQAGAVKESLTSGVRGGVSNPPSAAPPPKVPDPKVAKAAAALAPIASKATGRSTDALSPNDYDGAFEAFSKQLANV